MKKNIAVCFGGVSPEHEVSVITGLQVMEQIDRDLFEPFAIYFTKEGLLKFQDIKKRHDFKVDGGKIVNFAKDEKGVYFIGSTPLAKRVYVDSAYLAFHGGYGEAGPVQGFFETLELPFTSPPLEASAISMNKQLTRQVLSQNTINVVRGVSVFSDDVLKDPDVTMQKVKKEIGLPAIIKPVHLGSSIGINVAKKEVELKKFLLEAAHVDSEILVEKLLVNFVEYNCSVRAVDGKLEASEVERPIKSDEILSFADKYQKGGNKKAAGMASLVRELPAKIPVSLKDKIQKIAREVFKATRCKGLVRIDFMVTSDNEVYVTEVNPIPGSMAFYLWEASGVSFTKQITDLIEQSIVDFKSKVGKKLDYQSDIVEKFVKV